MRVLFTCAATLSHWFFMAPLAQAVRAQGHEVLVSCPSEAVSAVRRAGLEAADRGPTPSAIGDSGFVSKEAFGREWGALAAHHFATVTETVRRWRPALVISDWVDFAGPLAAASCDVPWAEFAWGIEPPIEYRQGAAQQLAALAPHGLPTPVALLDQWPNTPRLRPATLLDPEPQTLRPAALHDQGPQTLRPAALLDQEPQTPRPGDGSWPGGAARWPLRFTAYSDYASLPQPLPPAGDRKRICLTIGTVLTSPEGRATAAAFLTGLSRVLLAALDVELLIAAEDGLREHWQLEDERVLHVGWLPLAEAVATCDAVVHHGGHGSTLTCLQAGRPALVLPQFGDQFANAAAVASAGAAITFDHVQAQPRNVATAVARLVRQDVYASAAERIAREMAQQPTLASTVDALSTCVHTGKWL